MRTGYFLRSGCYTVAGLLRSAGDRAEIGDHGFGVSMRHVISVHGRLDGSAIGGPAHLKD